MVGKGLSIQNDGLANGRKRETYGRSPNSFSISIGTLPDPCYKSLKYGNDLSGECCKIGFNAVHSAVNDLVALHFKLKFCRRSHESILDGCVYISDVSFDTSFCGRPLPSYFCVH